jgi:lipoprotein signal peptidase
MTGSSSAQRGAMAALFLIAVAADQWVKHLVETRLALYEQIDILPFLALFRTTNTGVAFSMFSWCSPGVPVRGKFSPASALPSCLAARSAT